MTPLFRWDGRYVGFRAGDHLFRPDGECFGWVDEAGEAWLADGRYLGEVFEESYVLRSRRVGVDLRTRRRMHPARPKRPLHVTDRRPRLALTAWEDGLALLGG